jgi:hypothetical protein
MAVIVVEDGTGLSTANSYATVAEAIAYHVNILNGSAWATATDQEAALIMATRLFDEKVAWKGIKKTKEQSLRWPRSYVYGADGYLVDNDSIPQWLKNATSEFARYLSISDRLAESDTKGFSHIKLDTLELWINRHDRIGVIPPSVWSIISPYGRAKGRSITLVKA